MNPEYKIVYDAMGCGLGDWWQLFRRKRFLCFTRWEYVTASSSRSEVVDALKKLIDLNWQAATNRRGFMSTRPRLKWSKASRGPGPWLVAGERKQIVSL